MPGPALQELRLVVQVVVIYGFCHPECWMCILHIKDCVDEDKLPVEFRS